MSILPTNRIRTALVGSLLAVTLLGVPSLVSPAGAASVTESRTSARRMTKGQTEVVGDINRSRAGHDRTEIATNGLMNQRAMKWAQHLVACQCLEHRAAPYGVTRGWCSAAENVGRSGNGGTLDATHDAFMRSTGHRHNILNPRWTDLGVGVAKDRHGEWFIVHVFADYAC